MCNSLGSPCISQDYHRFHLPVSGTIRCIRHVRGKLYTVNPIAVASTYANVYTQVRLLPDTVPCKWCRTCPPSCGSTTDCTALQNKRAVVIIDSPEFGPVAVVCIGATMVGSIVFTGEEGKSYNKVCNVATAAGISCSG